MIRIAIVLGSTRPGRLGKAVADWVSSRASERGDATFDVLDVADFDLPLLDEPLPPSLGRYSLRTPRPGPKLSTDSTATSSSRASTTTRSPGR